MKQLTDIMGMLRSDRGCPWDREQTLESLKQYLIEECYELLDAIDSGDCDRHRDELGDVLLQILFQAQIRKEQGCFTFDDVASSLAEKLVRRHPHVFGDGTAHTPQQVLKKWEEIKSREGPSQPNRSAIRDIPRHLPALMKAQRVQERAARVGFDWDNTRDILAKIEEEFDELQRALQEEQIERHREEAGDLLFAVVNFCRFNNINAEQCLDDATTRFVKRFQAVEERVRREGADMADCSALELDAHWEAVKKTEKAAGNGYSQ